MSCSELEGKHYLHVHSLMTRQLAYSSTSSLSFEIRVFLRVFSCSSRQSFDWSSVFSKASRIRYGELVADVFVLDYVFMFTYPLVRYFLDNYWAVSLMSSIRLLLFYCWCVGFPTNNMRSFQSRSKQYCSNANFWDNNKKRWIENISFV